MLIADPATDDDNDIIAHIFRHRIGSDHTEWNLSRGMRMSSQKSLLTLILEYGCGNEICGQKWMRCI